MKIKRVSLNEETTIFTKINLDNIGLIEGKPILLYPYWMVYFQSRLKGKKEFDTTSLLDAVMNSSGAMLLNEVTLKKCLINDNYYIIRPTMLKNNAIKKAQEHLKWLAFRKIKNLTTIEAKKCSLIYYPFYLQFEDNSLQLNVKQVKDPISGKASIRLLSYIKTGALPVFRVNGLTPDIGKY